MLITINDINDLKSLANLQDQSEMDRISILKANSSSLCLFADTSKSSIVYIKLNISALNSLLDG